VFIAIARGIIQDFIAEVIPRRVFFPLGQHARFACAYSANEVVDLAHFLFIAS
jgi:hypothetical protein